MTEPRKEPVRQSNLPEWLTHLPEPEQEAYTKIFSVMRQLATKPEQY